ncbi:response regulator transcription factor [Nitrospirillum viridazoti]|uniref:DNA-binding response regulator n=1 Tax=Nitrospirillum viridazoti CBAmc TaxID=1441467 RepID=A0A248K0Q4_9PROT|nr:response regulator transcription factor [Nitrospirillum amazonense]ASG24379.1 DNA-binding response regulator [Nitrospirillum amazonense CBAmc]TWB33333.1 LuxR family two component transcriptional regulator [Nitrospirillum amazonense]
MTTALVVDDHPIVYQGCRRVLQDMGVDAVFDAGSVVAGYRSYLRRRPDMVIVDLTFSGDDLGGLALIRRIRTSNANARIVVFSMHNDPTVVARALECGALGYVLKDAPPAELMAACERALAGEPHLNHKLAVQVALLRSRGNSLPMRDLSEREKQVLALLARGNNYDQIAAKLGVSYKTVANASSLMRDKLRVKNLAGLIRFAIANQMDG